MMRVIKPVTLITILAVSFFIFKNRSLPETSHVVNKQFQGEEAAPTQKDISTTKNSSTSEKAPLTKNETYEALHDHHSDTVEGYVPEISPCKVRMGYKLGIFDEHFGISRSEFLREIKNAEELWEEAAKKDLFFYDENGSLTINLIYDERQRNTEKINYLALEIDNSKLSAEVLKEGYESDKISYEKALTIFIQEAEVFKKRQNTYQDEVVRLNTLGGAPKEDFERLTKERQWLEQEAVRLDAEQTKLSVDVESINTRVKKYNEFVSYINSLIKESNSLGGKKFTEGRFVPSTNTIDIYSYKDTTKLRRVVTHELGHALGVDHTTTRDSIMYSVNIGTTISLSEEDIEALRVVCK